MRNDMDVVDNDSGLKTTDGTNNKRKQEQGGQAQLFASQTDEESAKSVDESVADAQDAQNAKRRHQRNQQPQEVRDAENALRRNQRNQRPHEVRDVQNAKNRQQWNQQPQEVRDGLNAKKNAKKQQQWNQQPPEVRDGLNAKKKDRRNQQLQGALQDDAAAINTTPERVDSRPTVQAESSARKLLRHQQSPEQQVAFNIHRQQSRKNKGLSESEKKQISSVEEQGEQFAYAFRKTAGYVSLKQEWTVTCLHCGCLYLKSTTASFRKKCCMGGDADDPTKMPPLKPLSDEVIDILTTDLTHFGSACTSYNNILALAATGVQNYSGAGGWCHDMFGDHAVKLQGRTYHFIPPVKNGVGPNGGLSYHLFDSRAALAGHAASRGQRQNADGTTTDVVKYSILERLYEDMRKSNPLAMEIAGFGEDGYLDKLQEATNDDEMTRVIATVNENMQYFEVASITDVRETSDRVLIFKLKSNRTSTVPMWSSLVEPLSYPLLFNEGERGWGKDTDAVTVDFARYLASRAIRPEKGLMFPSLLDPSKLLNVNRFQAMSRLGQTFFVDMLSRAIDTRLDWHKRNQHNIFGVKANQRSEMAGNNRTGNHLREEQAPDDSNTTFLSSSLHGSPRHLKQKANEALCLVSEYGKPSLFITLTTNPYWPEIQEMLLVGQTAFDRPDIVDMVFHQKVHAMLENLRKGVYFPGQKVEYLMHVVEYQHRGLPHVHIVVRFENSPDTEDATADWIDNVGNTDANISACMPPQHDVAVTPEQIADNLYRKKVQKHMLHQCAVATNGCKKTVDSQCKRGYERTEIKERTTFDELGYPQYRRLQIEDLKVVPHNRRLLMDWDGHANVESAATAKSVLYLYSYLYKGQRKVKVTITNSSGEEIQQDEKDEIKLYLNARFLCAMDAYWRIFSYPTYPGTFPGVSTIKIKDPVQLTQLLDDKLSCDMLAYLHRPLALAELKYTELFRDYLTGYDLPVSYQPPNICEDGDYYVLDSIVGLKKPLYLYRRSNNKRSVVRLEMIYITAGEPYFLRLITKNRAFMSFDDAKTVNGTTYNTFQQAAVAANYIEDENDVIVCFDEACRFGDEMADIHLKPSGLRGLFAHLTLNGYPTLRIFDNERYLEAMIEDWTDLTRTRLTKPQAVNKLLEDLRDRLEAEGKCLEMYGFPEPSEQKTELEKEALLYFEPDQLKLYDNLERDFPNNDQQQPVIDAVVDAVLHPNKHKRLYSMSGVAGAGKTLVANKIAAKIRSTGRFVKICAATTLAAQNYENGTTAHKLFDFPVQDASERDSENPPQCRFGHKENRRSMLQETSLIIWDEFFTNPREIFESVYDILKDDRVVFLCIGDLRQILPVVVGHITETLQATFTSSIYWPRFSVFKLTINMRLAAANAAITEETPPGKIAEIMSEIAYAEAILAIGNGSSHHPTLMELERSSDGICTETATLGLRGMKFFDTSDREKALDWLYDGPELSPAVAMKGTILAVTNAAVDFWNTEVQKRNKTSEDPIVLRSKDEIADVDDPHGHLKKCLTYSILQDMHNNSDAPPHDLKLKVNDICLVVRALQADNLATNSRVQIVSIGTHVIHAKTIEEHPRYVFIPRIRFKFSLGYTNSFQITRTQFPLRLAYAITYNKSQGQTIPRMILDTTTDSFSHGHLYVALSRVRSRNDIRLFLNEETQTIDAETMRGDALPIVKNVFHPSVLNC